MAKSSSDDRQRQVLELAQAAAVFPHAKRLAFVQSRSSDPHIIREALALAGRLHEGEEARFRIGSTIGRFTLTEYLGCGGMGEVYAALDTDLGRTVAIKFLNSQWIGLAGAEERFIREARTASALNHPNIVTVHEVIRSDSTLAIVMERVDGAPLRQLCGQPLPLSQLSNIGQQIARALAAAHAARIVHRDIKPENVMLRSDGRLKVLDFGLARWSSGQDAESYHSTHSALPAGTWRYMSPEHYRNQPLGPETDIFAFGLVLYEMAAGRHPFSMELPLDTLHAIATEEAEPPSTHNRLIPAGLDSLILGMLAKDPAKRPTAEAVASALKKYDSAASAGASPPTYGSKRRFLAAVLVLLLLGLVVLIWKIYPARGAPVEFKRITVLRPENRATAAAISPDGKLLAYANIDGIFLRVMNSGETSLLNGPRNFVVDHLAWLPDGTKMIASGFSEPTYKPAIWSVSITQSPARELRTDARYGIPSPDGSRVAFVSGDHTSIWTMSLGGDDPRELIRNPQEDTFPLVMWSSSGRHLLFQRRHYSGKLDNGFAMFERNYRRSFESANAGTGEVVARLPDVWVRSAVSLADGRILLLRAESHAEPFARRLWEVSVDPSSGRFRGPIKNTSLPSEDADGRMVAVSATTDGATVMVLREFGQAAVFVADFQPSEYRFSKVRRLTLDERSNYPHAWTSDSSSVIFESNRAGSWDIFRQRIDERVPDTIIATPKRWEVLPQISPDGKFVLYAAGPTSGAQKPYTLMRVPVEGGTAAEVPTGGPLDEFRCSIGAAGRCVIRTTLDHDNFVYSSLDPVRGIGQELARTSWLESLLWDWDISPDGKLVAVPNHDSRSARVRVIALSGNSSTAKEHELTLPGLANISGLTWSADGRGWFVAVDTPVGRRIVYCDREARLHSLGDINGWIVPAPDGKRVAYLNTLLETNAWIAARQ
jgi:eukaryotic-like serine/threonine-protein kinase